jgi:transposase
VIVATIGSLCFIAMQGEVCAPIGMRIKDALRRKTPLFVCAYMGEHNLYIPTREIVRLDAYQAQVIRIQYASPVGCRTVRMHSVDNCRRGRACLTPDLVPRSPSPFLTDAQWLLIADLFPDPPVSPEGGRPRISSRKCLEGILWILTSGARWKDLPERYPSPATCWRRHRDWTRSCAFEAAWARLLDKLDRLRRINWEEAIGDGSFSRAKRGVTRLAALRKATVPASC